MFNIGRHLVVYWLAFNILTVQMSVMCDLWIYLMHVCHLTNSGLHVNIWVQ